MKITLEGELHVHPATHDVYFNGMDWHKILEALLPENYRCSCRDHGDPVRITIEADPRQPS